MRARSFVVGASAIEDIDGSVTVRGLGANMARISAVPAQMTLGFAYQLELSAADVGFGVSIGLVMITPAGEELLLAERTHQVEADANEWFDDAAYEWWTIELPVTLNAVGTHEFALRLSGGSELASLRLGVDFLAS